MWLLRVVDLHETVRLFDENLFGKIGVTEQIEGLRPQPKADRIPMLPPPGREGLQRALSKDPDVTQHRHCTGNVDQSEGVG